MIISERFVFIHMHKTGGQSLNDIIKLCISNHQVVGYHFPRSEVPQDAVELPVVGMVRNPWSWYASWFAFNKRPRVRNPLFEVVSGGGSADFKTTITNLIQLGSDRPESMQHRDDLIRLLPDSLDGNRGVGLTKDNIRDLPNAGTGYYSWLFEHMLGDTHDARTCIGRFENLQDDFLAIMEQLEVEESESLKVELDKRERKNFSRHSHYSHYYNDELRDLIASEEQRLIERFNYEFESIKPSGVSYEFPDDAYSGTNKDFRKLLGRASNFLRLNDEVDVTAIKKAVDQIPAARWLESGREKLFAVHRDTQSLQLVHFEDHKYKKPEYFDLFFELETELRPVLDFVASYYQNNGFIVRMILAKLVAGGKIPKHTDAGFSLLNCHRVHLPIITNNDVIFSVGGEDKNMRVGELWEINNGAEHAVENRSNEDRVHLIVDWMPNYAGKSEEEVLAADQLEGADRDVADEAMLGTIIERAHQQHQSGQVARAESLYRQVLHYDGDHVVANNLLGLLCLQTRRFDEAVKYIENALSVMPDDAQAHANLGLAMKCLNRLDDAAEHFQKSLQIEPGNPRACNNLGGIYISLGRVEDSVACFQQAVAIQPAFPEVHFNLGSALLHLQRYDEAVTSLRRCLQIKPDFEECRIKLEQAQQQLK
jgi:Tfp pilus assembly protein PilF/quercetin dioxygenase-like cupin family protein